MGMLKEFKEFAIKGNAIDMAVGIVIGAAFGKIVSSLVADIITPPLGLLLGKMDFSDFVIPLQQATENTPAVTINLGLFINAILDFVIVAFAIFMVIKQLNRLKSPPPAPAPAATTKQCPYCLMEIPLQATRCGHCTSELH